METPLFSIIVPVYCGAKYVPGILANIQAQGLDCSEWELILIDDASPDGSGQQLLQYANEQVRVILSPENRRQGGARNIGINAARGTWILFLDQDDRFASGALITLEKYLSEAPDEVDLVFTDYEVCGSNPELVHFRNDEHTMSGAMYLSSQGVPPVPWATAYRKSFLQTSGLLFPEKVQFEDTDFVIHALMKAQQVCYTPLVLIQHWLDESQQSYIGSNRSKIEDVFKLANRIGKLGEEEILTDQSLGNTVLGYHRYYQGMFIKRYLWRLPRRQMAEVLVKYPASTLPHPLNKGWLRLSARHPRAFAWGLWLLWKPAASAFRLAYRTLRHKDIR